MLGIRESTIRLRGQRDRTIARSSEVIE